MKLPISDNIGHSPTTLVEKYNRNAWGIMMNMGMNIDKRNDVESDKP